MSAVPLFPLPETVLFPNVDLPLHLFEPRYRQMAEDVADGDPRIVVVLLRPGWEGDYYGAPAVHDVATLGRVVHHERLEDGRFNIVLRGIERVRVHEPDVPAEEKLYRRRIVSPLPEARLDASAASSKIADRLLGLGTELSDKSGQPNALSSETDEREDLEHVVNTLACFTDLPPEAKQSLLEENDILVRAARLEGLLEETLRFWRTLARFRSLAPEDPRVN